MKLVFSDAPNIDELTFKRLPPAAASVHAGGKEINKKDYFKNCKKVRGYH